MFIGLRVSHNRIEPTTSGHKCNKALGEYIGSVLTFDDSEMRTALQAQKDGHQNFREKKTKIKEITNMATPHHTKKCVVCIDASKTAVGASLNHEDQDGRLSPDNLF